MSTSNYLSAYSAQLQDQIARLLEQDRLTDYLLQKYPTSNNVPNDSALREYVLNIKKQYLRKSPPLSKVVFDKKIHVVNNALGFPQVGPHQRMRWVAP